MAGKTKDMSKIKQLLLLKRDGVSNRKAADFLGMNKETVNNYVNKARADMGENPPSLSRSCLWPTGTV